MGRRGSLPQRRPRLWSMYRGPCDYVLETAAETPRPRQLSHPKEGTVDCAYPYRKGLNPKPRAPPRGEKYSNMAFQNKGYRKAKQIKMQRGK